MAGFTCQRCGACCLTVQRIVALLPPEAQEFHGAADNDGRCQYLRERPAEGGYECAVYDQRPNYCRFSWVAKKMQELGIEPSAFARIVRKTCEHLRRINDNVNV